MSETQKHTPTPNTITFAWHIHHNILVEPLDEPIETRIAYIKVSKPEHEQALRLRLLNVVQGELPSPYITAWQEYNAARRKYDAARRKYDAAWQKYDAAWQDFRPQIEALHAIECPDCPWNGQTIFSKITTPSSSVPS